MEEITTPGGMRCMINVPKDRTNLGGLIFLHGIGEVGTNIAKVLKYGPLKQLQDGVDLGAPKVIIHPLNVSSGWSILEIDEVVNYMLNHPAVNPDRVVLSGVSLGGGGVWAYAQSAEHVKKIAAIVPICGGSNDLSKAGVIASEGIPGWAAHAKNDSVVPYSKTKNMVDAINAIAQKPQILFSEYGIYGHSAWNYFLKPEYGVYDWMSFQSISSRKKATDTSTLELEIDYNPASGFAVHQKS